MAMCDPAHSVCMHGLCMDANLVPAAVGGVAAASHMMAVLPRLLVLCLSRFLSPSCLIRRPFNSFAHTCAQKLDPATQLQNVEASIDENKRVRQRLDFEVCAARCATLHVLHSYCGAR
jgi:hypothetical protein